MGFRPHRTGEDIEHGPALSAAIIQDRCPAAVVRGLLVGQLVSVWTGKALRMERPLQVLVALLLAEQLVNWKADHPTVSGTISRNVSGEFTPSRKERLFSPELT
jgi:hypothetical protein